MIFLTCTDKGYPERLGFSFLNDIKKQFIDDLNSKYGNEWPKEIRVLDRPYAYIQFGIFYI